MVRFMNNFNYNNCNLRIEVSSVSEPIPLPTWQIILCFMSVRLIADFFISYLLLVV